MKIVDNLEEKLYFGVSKIPEAGVGTFTGMDIPEGIPVCEYKGEITQNNLEGSQRLLKKYEYTLKLGFDTPHPMYALTHRQLNITIDCQPALTKEEIGAGGFVNDKNGWKERSQEEFRELYALYTEVSKTGGSSHEANEIQVDLGYNCRYWMHPTEPMAYLLSLRDIKSGEELYVDYGEKYWIPFAQTYIKLQAASKPKKADIIPNAENLNKNVSLENGGEQILSEMTEDVLKHIPKEDKKKSKIKK
jgi:hypothetical protein